MAPTLGRLEPATPSRVYLKYARGVIPKIFLNIEVNALGVA